MVLSKWFSLHNSSQLVRFIIFLYIAVYLLRHIDKESSQMVTNLIAIKCEWHRIFIVVNIIHLGRATQHRYNILLSMSDIKEPKAKLYRQCEAFYIDILIMCRMHNTMLFRSSCVLCNTFNYSRYCKFCFT